MLKVWVEVQVLLRKDKEVAVDSVWFVTVPDSV
jgi:hypothetical protein